MNYCFNLERIEYLFKQQVQEDLTIENGRDWSTFLNKLLYNDMIDEGDLLRISETLLVFPIDLERTLRIFEQIESNDLNSQIEVSADKLYTQLNDLRSTLKQWDLQTFTTCMLKQIRNSKYKNIPLMNKEFNKEYDQFTQDILIVNQPIQVLKQRVSEYPNTTLNPYQYQENYRDEIEREFNKVKIRGVQYRNQAIKTIKSYSSGIIRQIGFDSIKDFPVEVYRVPKLTYHLHEQNEAILTVEAHHELFLSPHFPKYLGCNLVSDPDYYQYFIEITKGVSLKNLLKNRQKNKPLKPQNPLFLMMMKEIYHAFWDLLQMTKYTPYFPIKLKNIIVMHQGNRVMLKNVKFECLRNPDEDNKVEAKLLENFANLMIQILEITPKELDKIEYFISLKKFLEAILWAEEDVQLFEKNIIQDRLTFAQLSKHDLLTEGFEMQDIVKDYKDVFGDELVIHR